MTKAAKKRPHLGKRIKDIRNSESEIYSLLRRLDSPSSIQSGGSDLGGGGVGAPPAGGPWLPIAGGQMIGPIAFFPKLLTIGDGEVDVSAATGTGYSSRIIVTPESGATDNLLTITGAAWSGQLLILQGVESDTLTIKNATSAGTAWVISTGYVLGDEVANGGNLYSCKQAHTSSATDEPGVGANWTDFWFKANIETLDNNDFSLVNDAITIFIFDSTDNKWQQVLAGSGGTQTFNEVNLGDTLSGGVNVDCSLGNKFRGIVTGNVTITFINTVPTDGKYQPVVLELRNDAVGGHIITFADPFENGHVPIVTEDANEYNVWAFYFSNRQDAPAGPLEPVFAFNTRQTIAFTIAMSDEYTPLAPPSTVTPFVTLRAPIAMVVTEVRASLTTAGTGSSVLVDVHESGSTILTGDISIGAGGETATGSVLDGNIAKDAELEFFLISRDSGNTATGLKVSLVGYIE